MLQLLIIADDFTGALDTGVQFSKRGIATIVTTDIKDWQKAITANTEVLVLDTESRYLDGEAAYNRLKKILSQAKAMNIQYLYKKVDSALRGNISAEIKAIVDTYPDKFIPFLPAHPRINRNVIQGVLYVDGVPVNKSVFADDPYEPVLESNILKRLEQEANIYATYEPVNSSQDLEETLTVFDSESINDMDESLKKIQKIDGLAIAIGCAAFAEILAQNIFIKSDSPKLKIDAPLVVISGSVNKITESQIAFAEDMNYPRISLTTEQILDENYWETDKGLSDINHFNHLLKNANLIMFETLSPSTQREVKLALPQKSQNRFTIGKSLGQLTRHIWEISTQGTFLFTGGDTLFQCMEVLGVEQIQPITEISSGVVLAQIKWQDKWLNVITKSGGFGEKDVFVRIVNLIEEV